MNITLNSLPKELWRQIATYDDIDNKFIRLNRETYSFFLNDINKMKIIYDCFSNLQSYFEYECPLFSVTFNPLSRLLICFLDKNEIKMSPCESKAKEILDFDIIIRPSLGFIKSKFLRENNEENDSFTYFCSNHIYSVKHPIQKIDLIKSPTLNAEDTYILEKAKNYANKFYEKSL
jgi:hypothetical protein